MKSWCYSDFVMHLNWAIANGIGTGGETRYSRGTKRKKDKYVNDGRAPDTETALVHKATPTGTGTCVQTVAPVFHDLIKSSSRMPQANPKKKRSLLANSNRSPQLDSTTQ